MLVYFGQDWLLFPGASNQGSRETLVRQVDAGSELVHLAGPNNTHITALFGQAELADGRVDPDAAGRATILYFYGNGSCVAWSSWEMDHFRRLGVNVLCPDYLGYGMSDGKPSEANLYATADAAYDYLVHRPAAEAGKIIAVGWSLGGAVAIDLASRRPVAGLVVFNAFTSLGDMAHKTFPWLPTRLLVKYRLDNLAKIARITCPTFICNGVLDTLVPPAMSDRLAAAAGGTVTRLKIAEADHNSIFTASPKELLAAMRGFLETAGMNEHGGTEAQR